MSDAATDRNRFEAPRAPNLKAWIVATALGSSVLATLLGKVWDWYTQYSAAPEITLSACRPQSNNGMFKYIYFNATNSGRKAGSLGEMRLNFNGKQIRMERYGEPLGTFDVSGQERVDSFRPLGTSAMIQPGETKSIIMLPASEVVTEVGNSWRNIANVRIQLGNTDNYVNCTYVSN